MKFLIAGLIAGLIVACGVCQASAQCQSSWGGRSYSSGCGAYSDSYSSGCGNSYSSGCGATYSSGCGAYSSGTTYRSGCAGGDCGMTYGGASSSNNQYYYGYPMLTAVGTTGAHTWNRRLDSNNNPFVDGKKYRMATNNRWFIYTGGYFYPVEENEATYGGKGKFQEGQTYQLGNNSYIYTGGVFYKSKENPATEGNPLYTPLQPKAPAPGLPDIDPNQARKANGNAGNKG